MRYKEIKDISEKKFRRLTGVTKKTFKRMQSIVEAASKLKMQKGGRPSKNSVNDMILMTLMYLREYRPFLHIGQTYGIAESNTYRTIKWVEEVLMNSGEFRLPGKKELSDSDNEYEFYVIDDTESPIERPKKTKESTTRVKNANIH